MKLMILLPMLLPLVSQLDMPSSFATVTLRTANQTQSQMASVDNNLMRENDPRMPLFNDRQSKVTFGQGN